MRNTKKKKLSLQKLSIASIANVDIIKGMSEGTCSTIAKSYPPYMCMQTIQKC